jgi:hypothetical protein
VYAWLAAGESYASQTAEIYTSVVLKTDLLIKKYSQRLCIVVLHFITTIVVHASSVKKNRGACINISLGPHAVRIWVQKIEEISIQHGRENGAKLPTLADPPPPIL